MRTAQAVRTNQSFPCAPLGSNPHGQTMQTAFADRTARTSKDHSSRTTGTHDPKAIRVQSSRSFMLQRARFIMLLKARRWPVSSQDLPERVIILFTMSNNPHAHDGRGNSLWALDPQTNHKDCRREHPLFDETPEQPSDPDQKPSGELVEPDGIEPTTS
jgi:hypothetical protein